MRRTKFAFALCWAFFVAGCSPSDWAAVNAAGSTIGAAADTFAVIRAEQIRQKAASAEKAAASGDTLTAMREMNAALAAMAASTWEELGATKAELQELRARCPAPPPPTSSTATPSPTPEAP